MTPWICETCGTQHAPSPTPPDTCLICADERQYVGAGGQRWTTLDALDARHDIRLEETHGLLALEVTPAFAIGQRAFLLPTDAGNLLWEALRMVTEEAVAALRARGGVDRIIVSHPHFHASMVAWSEALGGVPILLHEADRGWIQRPDPRIELWSGDTLRLSDDVTLIRCGGHFPGSTALHWRRGPRPGGALFAGDALQVARDRRHVAFMYSYPNMVPMRTADVVAMRERLAPFDYQDVFGYAWDLEILGDGRRQVERSFARHLAAVRDTDRRPLRIAVLGAAGRVGSRVVSEALQRGHVVTGVVRKESQRSHLPGGAIVEVVDAADPTAIERLASAQDVVIDATRPIPDAPDTTVATTRGILGGMRSTGARLLVSGGAAVLDVPGQAHQVVDDPALLPASILAIAQASALQYRLVANEAEVDWAYLCPPLQLEPGERTGSYTRGTHTLLLDDHGRSRISMEDLAVALLDEAEHPRVHRDRFTVAAG